MKLFALAVAVLQLLGCARVRAAELRVGDAAPDFALPGSDGKTHSLAEHRGRRAAVVLAWLPRAFTGG